MTPPRHERGAALLTVLMLVAVIATVAVGALDRLTVATRLAANANVAAQGRLWLGFAEQLAAVRLEDLAAADPARTAVGPWLGTVRQVRLPDGGLLTAEVRDGGNCFNLNSLVRRDASGQLSADPRMVQQLSALLVLIGTDRGRADAIAAASADWADSDSIPLPGGAEAGSYGAAPWTPANGPFADVSEWGGVRGVTPDLLSLATPFLCALPETAPSALNPNSLRLDQAALLAMLAPDRIGLAQARAALAVRPPQGFASSIAFWQSPALANSTIPPEAAEQVQLKSRWFELRATLRATGQEMTSVTLIDLSTPRARIVRRRYGDAA